MRESHDGLRGILSLAIIMSNFAFLLPITIIFKHKLLLEGVIGSLCMITSIVYHVSVEFTTSEYLNNFKEIDRFVALNTFFVMCCLLAILHKYGENIMMFTKSMKYVIFRGLYLITITINALLYSILGTTSTAIDIVIPIEIAIGVSLIALKLQREDVKNGYKHIMLFFLVALGGLFNYYIEYVFVCENNNRGACILSHSIWHTFIACSTFIGMIGSGSSF
jgi:hypothetical protein